MSKKFIKALVVAFSLTLISPIAKMTHAATTAPEITGGTAITMDLDSNEVIYSKDADKQHALASTTKLLTALLFAENKNKTDLIPYTKTSIALDETTLNTDFLHNTVKVGDTLTADEVMKGLLMYSANDTALLMAESVGGTVDKFAEMMNAKAAELGATGSKFVNPHGLEEGSSYNVTTAHDLALIAKAAYENEWIRETMQLTHASINLNGGRIDIEPRNKLLGKDGNIGGKTGTETLAGRCFVGFYERDGRHIVTVVLGSSFGVDGMDVFTDTKSMADYSYSAEKVPFKKSGDEIGTMELTYKAFRFFGPEKTITVPYKVNQDVNYYDNDYNKANSSITYAGDATNAWKAAGHKDLTFTFKSGAYTEEVKGSMELSTFDLIKANFLLYVVTIVIVVIIVVLVLVIFRIFKMRQSKRSRYYRRR